LEPLPAFVHAENRGFLHGDCLSTRGRMSSRMPPRWDGDGEHGMAVAAGIFPQHFICAFYSYNVTTGIILPSATVAHEVTRWPRGVLSQAGFSARARLDDSAVAQHQPLERTARATLPG
jgi:hypothetical protein